MSRPSWDEYFISIAEMAASRSTCPRLSVGALVVFEGNVLSTGFNGAPSGLPHCEEEGCIIVGDHCIRTVHAEVNALIRSHMVREATLYCTDFPCLECCKLIINAGIVRVVYKHVYIDNRCNFFTISSQEELLRKSYIEVTHITPE